MKHTSNILKYFAFIFSLSALFSCNSLIDKAPLTEYSDQNFWQDQAHASAALSGAYNRLQQAMNTEFIYYGEGRADLLKLDVQNNTSSIGVINNTLSPNVSFADWSNFYDVIKQCNLIIDHLPIMLQKGIYLSSTDAEYKRVLGQAYALRGYIYFYMTRIWGNVPLVTQPVDLSVGITSLKTPRTDTLEIYKQVTYDLYLASSLLPASYSGNGTRITITKGAVDAVLTDYYMTRNMPDSALYFSQRVIGSTQYSLVPLYQRGKNFFDSRTAADAIDSTAYAQMFLDGYSQESIWEIDYNYEENTNSGIAGVYGNTGNNQFVADNRIFNIFNRFENDLRTKVAFKNTNWIYKYFEKGPFDRLTMNDKNIILYRLADIMLMRAEALNTKGDREGAWSIIKTIRERSFGPVETQSPTDPTKPLAGTENPNNDFDSGPTSNFVKAEFLAMTKEQAEDEILNERARELCFEGKRWFDLVRTGRAIPKMGPINGLQNQENILWPIGINIIKQNPQIEQNSFYK